MSAPLPALEIVGQSYRLLRDQPLAWARALALPLAINLAVQFAFLSVYGPSIWQAMNLEQPDADPGITLRAVGMSLCLLIAFALFAVAWHRFALIGPAEAPRLLPAVQGYHVRFILTMIGLSLLIGLVAVLPFILADLLGIYSQLIPLLALVVAVALAVRLQLVFPAVALDRRLGLAGSWRATKGQGLRLFWMVLLSVLPWQLLSLLLGPVIGPAQGQFVASGQLTLAAALGFAVSGLIEFALLAVLVGTISGAYRRLVDPGQ